MEAFARYLRREMERKGITQQEAAARLRMSQQNVSAWLAGEKRRINSDQLALWTHLLDADEAHLRQLLGGDAPVTVSGRNGKRLRTVRQLIEESLPENQRNEAVVILIQRQFERQIRESAAAQYAEVVRWMRELPAVVDAALRAERDAEANPPGPNP